MKNVKKRQAKLTRGNVCMVGVLDSLSSIRNRALFRSCSADRKKLNVYQRSMRSIAQRHGFLGKFKKVIYEHS